ncbi:hypothetical protein FEM33_17320 [Dyadobacter flavalbus]|uniref:Uncharacterized protein n=1 Tax=Dyadobacter flavalbus TaxID=2579942 RepID=A0A5M8QUY1_9BACT|nr:hypothetical protein [Dyadobacter flavalbus]KAA6438446.1 hypothetical protein FEM33_17320 [Dyadobacter flavalbus]
MKTEKLVVLCMILLFVQLVACEKTSIETRNPEKSGLRSSNDSIDDQSQTRYITTDTIRDISQQSPALFTLINGISPYVMWRVIPSASVNNNGTSAIIYFQKEGKHRVFAIDSMSFDTTYIDVEVAPFRVVEPKIHEQSFYNDDEVYITPFADADTAEVLQLKFVTKRSYDCTNNRLIMNTLQKGSNYEVGFEKVASGTYCSPGEKKAQNSTTYLTKGNKGNIQITFNGKIYNGSFERKGFKYTFNWPYESGAVFTTKSL